MISRVKMVAHVWMVMKTRVEWHVPVHHSTLAHNVNKRSHRTCVNRMRTTAMDTVNAPWVVTILQLSANVTRGLVESVVMRNKITALFMEINVKMVAPVWALVQTVSTVNAPTDTAGPYVRVKLIFVLPIHVKMEGPAPTYPMVFHASALSSTQVKGANKKCKITVHQILDIMEESVSKVLMVLHAIAFHPIPVRLAL